MAHHYGQYDGLWSSDHLVVETPSATQQLPVSETCP